MSSHAVVPKLLDQIRLKICYKHYSIRTEEAYVDWNRRFIRFHHKRHPKDLGAAEVEQFLSYLAVEGKFKRLTLEFSGWHKRSF
ncbi:MAG: hypothetical protein HC877_11325 [Thioploca sp.]|nr:hypothetical protein [Thioploca sp.]